MRLHNASFYPYFLASSSACVGVAFKDDNGKYLSRVSRGGYDNIEVAKTEKDHYTRFVATEINGKLVLQADNGKYISRINRRFPDGGSIDFIEASKGSPDVYSQFTVLNQPDGTVVLKADSGKYMGRVNRDGVDLYEAAKDQIDVYCKLKLEFQL